MSHNGYSRHAGERALEIYGDWLNLTDVAYRINRGEYLRQQTGEGNRYIFDVDMDGKKVRVVAAKNEKGKWHIITALPTEFRAEHFRRASKNANRRIYKQLRRGEEESLTA